MTGPSAAGSATVFVADPDELCRRHLTPGMRVHIASTMSRPNALALSVARVFGGVGTFEISVNALHAGVHALTMAKVVERAVIAFAGDTVPTSRPNRLYARLTSGDPFPVEEWSLLSLLQRLMAGATGAPAALCTSLVSSSLPQGHPPLETVPNQTEAGQGEAQAVLVPALCPDVTLLHAQCADRRGNLYLSGPVGEGWWGAMAARRGVLATVEQVCDGPRLGCYTAVTGRPPTRSARSRRSGCWPWRRARTVPTHRASRRCPAPG